MLVKNSFLILNQKMEELLKSYNFDITFNDKEGIFKSKDRGYTIKYDSKNKMISLFDLENQREDPSYKGISSWFFDEEESTSRDIDDICNDFFEIMVNKKNETKVVKKNSPKDGEENVGIIFFMNRLANIFPNIKEKISVEKDNNKNFRAVKFLNDEVLPEIHKLLCNKKDNKIEKFFKLLENMYKNGDLDVRCIISMGILNNIDKEDAEIANKYLSEDLKKVRKASLKYKK